MNKDEIISKTVKYVKEKLSGEGSGHDWWHVYRVWKNAQQIAKKEKADSFIVELAALLHDIADWKFNDGDEKAGSNVAKEWLKKNKIENETTDHVCRIIDTTSFKGAGIKTKMESLEGEVVQDADRLDAIGAIGIARAFATGAKFDEIFHDPNVSVKEYKSAAEYVASKKQKGRTVINHFYEKLLLLKDLMNTKTGKEMAEERHKYMENFLKEFYAEWEGRA